MIDLMTCPMISHDFTSKSNVQKCAKGPAVLEALVFFGEGYVCFHDVFGDIFDSVAWVHKVSKRQCNAVQPGSDQHRLGSAGSIV